MSAEKQRPLESVAVRILIAETALEATDHLFREKVDMAVSKWKLPDMPDGKLLSSIIAAKPGIATIALVKANDPRQEVAARSLGVSVVLGDDVTDDNFRQIICILLGLNDVAHSKPRFAKALE